MPPNAIVVKENLLQHITSPTLQEQKQQLVRTAIWDAATDLFVEKGYDETTVDDIAQRAGISKRSFFRYFSSKSDLMAHGIVGYGTYLTEAIEACPQRCSLSEVFRKAVFQVARQCAEHPQTRKIMHIAAKYPEAKQSQLSRTAELQERVEEAFARRCETRSDGDLTPGILTGLLLSVLGVTFRSWFEQGDDDISIAAERVLATLGNLVCLERSIKVREQMSKRR